MILNLLLFCLIFSMKAQEESWEQNLLNKMTLQEKIAQLFVIRVNYNSSPDEFNYIKKLVSEIGVGGIIPLKRGTVEIHKKILKELHSCSKYPLIVMQDAEWGMQMRLKDLAPFAMAGEMIRIDEEDRYEKIYEWSRAIAKECKELGVHMNLAPVVDVNNNPKNPVIGIRSFSDDPYEVTKCAYYFIKGHHDENVLTCIKHFPGHGDTTVDSHIALPIIVHDIDHLNKVELVPFKELIKAADAVMTAHIYLPKLEQENNVPASLSYAITTELLQNQLECKSLIITDALDMGAITMGCGPDEAAEKAFLAGADILLCCEDVIGGIKKIEELIKNNRVNEQELDRRVMKILTIKKERKLTN
ncbi:hypothetical protein M1446_03345 [Candidatus Dependentiae bacterium]|nr:hypothetical protein [Candidatus Dependentiae bacterium]